MTPEPENLVEVTGLKKYYPVSKGIFRRSTAKVHAVDDVTFAVRRKEILSLVGESGCGKTTASRCIVGAIRPTAGSVVLRLGGGAGFDIAGATRGQMRPLRRSMQMIFQDPYSSLNPRMTLFDLIGEPLLVNGVKSRDERMTRVRELLDLVGLRREYADRYPHAFSGGQRQRVGIARALALRPEFIVADEPVSALDVSVQAQILNLLLDLQSELGLTILFVGHDLSVVKNISDRVAVMYVGRIVEIAPAAALFHTPRHPYTEALLAAVPKSDPDSRSLISGLPGEVADAINPPPGCTFHPRCKYAQAVCRSASPALLELSPGHSVRCRRAAELSLRGV